MWRIRGLAPKKTLASCGTSSPLVVFHTCNATAVSCPLIYILVAVRPCPSQSDIGIYDNPRRDPLHPSSTANDGVNIDHS